MFIHKRICLVFPLVCCLPASSQSLAHVEMVKVESRPSARTVPMTAELAPFLQTDIEAALPDMWRKCSLIGAAWSTGGSYWFNSPRQKSIRRLQLQKELHQAE